MFPSWKNALIIFPRSQLNIGQKIVRHNIYSITQIAIIISPIFAKDEEKRGQKSAVSKPGTSGLGWFLGPLEVQRGALVY